MKKVIKAKGMGTAGKALAIGAGVAAIAAAGYFLFGPKGKANRKVIRGWTIKMKGEIVEKMEAVKELTQDNYDQIVDAAAKTYVSVGGKEEVAKLAKELKSHWKFISGQKKSGAKKSVKK